MVLKKTVFFKSKYCESLREIFGAQDKVMLLVKMLLSDWNLFYVYMHKFINGSTCNSGMLAMSTSS